MVSLQASTWQALGLSVAASYIALGVMDCIAPQRAAEEIFGIAPTDEGSRAVRVFVPLLGARGLSIGAALLVLARQGKGPEMGIVILAGTILCVADVIAVWRAKGPRL
ncbi:hypothetical protein CMUS01_08948 [Colletotrichum musicola]|uniref:Uncharacterized protein n=1 Tax=Colletotrichum musicola TaxID=2175873 RepID=A0A8H6KAI8_9PEZI|nr:hypothetical protein CMUS01_08948 [Colletotrichum musicola]